MRISEHWLREWVDFPGSTEELAHRLTMAGLEVDAIEPAAPAFEGVVVGEIAACEPHPEADRLSVCRVVAGDGDPLQVVCGAPNARVGLKAPFARVGATLPDGTRIERATLRGTASEGMLCSARELGLSEDAAGLMALPPSAPAGADLREYLALDDTVIELELTPNRADCLGMAGVAREVGVLAGREPVWPGVEAVPPRCDAQFPVTLEAPAECPRYTGRVIRDVDTSAETPVWMRERLRRAGVRPLSITVDITNYVMLELGQPMHAFDLERLEQGIRVRSATKGERLALLNGQTVELEPGTLVIADAAGPVAMAGIMGGEPTAVTEATRHVFLEAAFFAPAAIAGRARAYGLHTDSSHRFERGVDPERAAVAVERATRLLVGIAGGDPGPTVVTERAEQVPVAPAVSFRPGRCTALLGAAIPHETMRGILERLGMAVAAGAEAWTVTPPSWRFDIAREVDLIEEIARIHGYDALPLSRTPAPLAMPAQPEAHLPLRRLRRLLVDRGYQEAITYSFVAPELQASLDPEAETLPLANPLSADLAVMRSSLWPGLVRALQHNRNRQAGRVRLFESGLAFRGRLENLEQAPRVAGIAAGQRHPEHWDAPRTPLDFFDVKGDVEALLALTGEPERYRFEPAAHPALHPGQSARVRHADGHAGWVGALHPEVLRRLDLDGPVFVFELDLGRITAARVPAFREISRYPAIRRDLAVVLPEAVSAAELRATVVASAGEALRELILFDVYRGKGVADGFKSLAIGLILQDSSRTLTDSDVDAVVARVVERLRAELQAELRE
ncbi:phenylalanine--tRNA ligase subunit beta [Sediminicurvatus halobius]|uniref:Phenylalanine--tRNA ligase beta subunit n=1 Tax=Sediminicurvatus halobius TaxID=2182432 RepID=A0A2U2MWD5_9GAMM|nr:phenylalanine--tRNA ligase subunit beta [Spiribacter halobius]PWG61096.1 phenylalanine--tRNA ligase subunit beta [Spiribacter halobius]UEX79675.1 phenylalanine--tRNA ligase subunit beta [Spiribacter halobius]